MIAKRDVAPEFSTGAGSRWLSNPPATGAKQLTVINVTLAPGKGHNFHKHPDQEEVIYVVAGQVEQWVDREKRMLGPGNCALCRPTWCMPRSMSGHGREDRRDPRPLRRPRSATNWSMCRRRAMERAMSR